MAVTTIDLDAGPVADNPGAHLAGRYGPRNLNAPTKKENQ